MCWFANYLMKKPIKYFVLFASIALLVVGALGAVRINQSFDMLHLGLEGSPFVNFYSYLDKAYPRGFSISVIIDEPIDYTDPDVQLSYSKLSEIPKENDYMKDSTLNWMQHFLTWSAAGNYTSSGPQFYTSIQHFLHRYKQYYADIRFKDGKIKSSRMIMFSENNGNSIFRKDMMLTLRQDLKSKSNLPVYPITLMFIYIEQFAIILKDTIRNLSICAGAILLITLPYLVHPLITFFVFFGFVSLIFELLGLMYIWNVSLNSISMIIIVMAIGFAVDYSAHVAHAFMISKAETPEKRVVDALKTMGTSVLMGGNVLCISV